MKGKERNDYKILVMSKVLGHCKKMQLGFNLVELSIATLLSIIIVGLALAFIFNSQQFNVTKEAQSRVLENKEIALTELRKAIQMAGYYGDSSPFIQVPSSQFYLGNCGSFSPCTHEGGAGNPDRIAVMLNPPPDDGTDVDCVGNSLSADLSEAAFSVVTSVYYIGPEVDGISSLMCQTFLVDSAGNSTPVSPPNEILKGVYDLQIRYGTSNLTAAGLADMKISAWEDAQAISNKPIPAGLSSTWINLKAVQLGLLIGTGYQDRGSLNRINPYVVFDETHSFSDGNLRQVFTFTVMMNNAQI